MENREEQLKRLKIAVERSHNCFATYHESVSVYELINDELWDGEVEVFRITNHPRATWCYAWSYKEGNEEKIATVLQVPPVISPGAAVRISLAEDSTKRRKT